MDAYRIRREPYYQPAGDVLAFVQDPWGFTLQLVKRAQAMV